MHSSRLPMSRSPSSSRASDRSVGSVTSSEELSSDELESSLDESSEELGSSFFPSLCSSVFSSAFSSSPQATAPNMSSEARSRATGVRATLRVTGISWCRTRAHVPAGGSLVHRRRGRTDHEDRGSRMHPRWGAGASARLLLPAASPVRQLRLEVVEVHHGDEVDGDLLGAR